MRQMSFSCAYRTMRRVRRRYGSKIQILLCLTPPPHGSRLVLRLPGTFPGAGGQTAPGKAYRRPWLPCQRFYCAGLSARFRRSAYTGCTSELLFADRLFRRRKKDDCGIPCAGAKLPPECPAPVRARPDAQASEGNEGCHRSWQTSRSSARSSRTSTAVCR